MSRGRPGENTKSARLASLIRERGFPDADFERFFDIIDPVTRKPTQRKPDVVFSDGGTHIVSAKDGEHLERESIATAIQYLRELSSITRLGEVFALTYPRKGEKYHLHVLPSGHRQEISLVLEQMEEVADAIVKAVQGRIAEIERRQEPVHEEAGRLLRYAATELAQSLRGVPDRELEEIFGGHDFFHSALATVLKGDERKSALRLGAAYLFVNQILFYVLLSQEAKRTRHETLYPLILSADRTSPQQLRDKYFSRVHHKDYEPIYGSDVARFFDETRVGNFLAQVVDTIIELAPKLTVPDLVGQIFQNLIPLKIRKPLGAHYTNPNAAVLLANIAIDDPKATILDPACGSGTLLVAAYRQKMKLARKADTATLHKTFVENDITGIDAMAFSSHLAAVNLALQQPLLETDFVRIGRADSTRLQPGSVILPTGEALPDEFRQKTLDDHFSSETGSRSVTRIPSMKQGKERPIHLSNVDIVIMNPPFTSQNNLAPEYRALLKKRFSRTSEYREIVYWKTSQQVYFLLLADLFLKEDGRVAAVLPFTTFTGHAFHPLIRYLVSNYTIETIIVGLGRSSFSEDTSLMECLFVARKQHPSRDDEFKLVAVSERTEKWTEKETKQIAEMAMKGSEKSGLGIVRQIRQTELLPENSSLSTLFLRLDSDYDAAWEALDDIYSNSSIPLIKVKELFQRGVEVTEVYHGEYRPLSVGPKAILASRTENPALKGTDRLVLQREGRGNVEFVDRINPEGTYRFLTSEVAACIRRFAYLSRIDITGFTDFIVTKIGSNLERTMRAFYTAKEGNRHLANIRRAGWEKIIARGSARVSICARANLAAPGTMLLAFRAEEPAFLAGAYGYNVRGFVHEREEKLFTLWFNSTMGLIELVAKATITEGTWIKLEQFTTEQLSMPDPAKVSEKQWQRIVELWHDVARETVPSLLTQLEQGDPVRNKIDITLLKLIGLDHTEAQANSAKLQRGALAAIRMLVRTMGPG